MNLIVGIGAFLAMFMALLAITKKVRNRADFPLVLYLIITSIHFSFYMFSNANNYTANALIIWITGLPLLYEPLMHFYIIGLIKKVSTRYLVHNSSVSVYYLESSLEFTSYF